jgi:hypothetical protein
MIAKMKAVCLSCFAVKDEQALNDVKNRLGDLNGSTFRTVKNWAQLKQDVADPALLEDLDILILAAHAYGTGEELEMRDGTRVPVGDVVAALKAGGLAEKAIVFVFACNGGMSGHWHRLFSTGKGPKLVFGPTRVARSVPLANVLIDATHGLLRKGLPKDRHEACAVADRFLAPDRDGSGPKTCFLGVLWGPSTADACRPRHEGHGQDDER